VDPTFKATVRAACVRGAFEVSKETPIVQTLGRATETVLNKPLRYFGDTPWMDSALLAAAGIETVVMGPAGAGAHASIEWVDIKSVEQCAQIFADTASIYCQ
jgi:acetylornithine deacetylase